MCLKVNKGADGDNIAHIQNESVKRSDSLLLTRLGIDSIRKYINETIYRLRHLIR